MRVAIFTDNDFDNANGVTTTLKAVLRHAPADITPRIYTFADLGVDQPDYLALESAGCPIPFYGDVRIYLPRMRALARCLKADGVQLIHLTTPGPSGLAARYFARRGTIPLIGSCHTQLTEYAQVLSGWRSLGALTAAYLRWLYGTCDRVLVPSNDTQSRLAADGWRPKRLAVWSPGVDCELFSPARRSSELRRQWGVSDRRPAILYAGRASREKGLGLLQDVSAILYGRRIAHRLIVVGDGPMLPELKEQCPDAVFMGRLTHGEVGAAIASADLFIFPSDTDTSGNVVLEAQACGVPTLVTDVGGPKENIDEGSTGFVCRDGANGFCHRIQHILATPDLLHRMSAAARAHMLPRSWRSSLEPLFAAYRTSGLGADATRRGNLGEIGGETPHIAPGL